MCSLCCPFARSEDLSQVVDKPSVYIKEGMACPMDIRIEPRDIDYVHVEYMRTRRHLWTKAKHVFPQLVDDGGGVACNSRWALQK